MISVILPSRGRPQRALETTRKWLANAGCDVEFLLSIDIDDPCKKEYYELFLGRQIICEKNRSAIDAINRAAVASKGNVIIQIAEDFECPPLWGMKVLNEVVGKEDWIMKTKDGIQAWMITLPLMDRKYFDRFGYIYHPDYLHMFCDTELTCVADLTGRKIEANILFPHLHYSTGKTQADHVSRRADASWQQGEKLFRERYKKNFDLKLCDLKGQITNAGILAYVKSGW